MPYTVAQVFLPISATSTSFPELFLIPSQALVPTRHQGLLLIGSAQDLRHHYLMKIVIFSDNCIYVSTSEDSSENED